MNVELPSTGCNILNSSTTFYNYSSDRRTRQTYVIYDGEAHLISQSTSQYGYDYTGTCMSTGDLVYKPELKIYFPFIASLIFVFSLYVVWRVIGRRLLP